MMTTRTPLLLTLLLSVLLFCAPAASQWRAAGSLAWNSLTNQLDGIGSVGGLKMVSPVRSTVPGRFDVVLIDTDQYGQGDHIVVLNCPMRDFNKVARFGTYVYSFQTQPVPDDPFGRVMARRCKSTKVIPKKFEDRARLVASALPGLLLEHLARMPDQEVAVSMRDALHPNWEATTVPLQKALPNLPALLAIDVCEAPPSAPLGTGPSLVTVEPFTSLEEALRPTPNPPLEICESHVQMAEERMEVARDLIAGAQLLIRSPAIEHHEPTVRQVLDQLDAALLALGGTNR